MRTKSIVSLSAVFFREIAWVKNSYFEASWFHENLFWLRFLSKFKTKMFWFHEFFLSEYYLYIVLTYKSFDWIFPVKIVIPNFYFRDIWRIHFNHHLNFSSRTRPSPRTPTTARHHIFQSSRRWTQPRRGRNRRPQEDPLRHLGPRRRASARLECRGLDWHLVAAQFRTRPVPLHPPAHNQAQRAKEAVFGSASGTRIFCRASKLQVGGRTLIRAVWQCSRLRTHYFYFTSSFGSIQFYLHVKCMCEWSAFVVSMYINLDGNAISCALKC